MKRELANRKDLFVCFTTTDDGYLVEVENLTGYITYAMLHDEYDEAVAHFEMFDPTQLKD